MDAPLDRDLVLRAVRGEVDAFGELVTRHQTSVFNVCYRILHERGEAEDMTQETFIRAHGRLNTFNIEQSFGPWIRRVAANVCFNYLESQKITIELNDETAADESQSPESRLEVRERSEEIHMALASLPPQYRIVVELRHYQEMSYDEIASELKIPLSDVKSHLFRARKILAEKLR